MQATNFDTLYLGGPLMAGIQFDTIPLDIGEAQRFVAECDPAGRRIRTKLDRDLPGRVVGPSANCEGGQAGAQ